MQNRKVGGIHRQSILTLEDLGLERTVSLHEVSRGLAERSEAADRPLGSVSGGGAVLRPDPGGSTVRGSLRV